ncbi:MAG: DUF1580 domain-containing protein [Phycisphaeraceae bacterium]|nr:DUF1580 domain-containing protein [Phycisphaeraceae bacterium]
MHEQDQHITLTQAAKITPGRPSTNCIWRWCRRGVLARNGQRVRLEHVRIGGKIFTTRRWVEAFGKALAEADTSYFDLPADGQAGRQGHRPQANPGALDPRSAAPPVDPGAGLPASPLTQPRRSRRCFVRNVEQRRAAIEQANRELEEAGL